MKKCRLGATEKGLADHPQLGHSCRMALSKTTRRFGSFSSLDTYFERETPRASRCSR